MSKRDYYEVLEVTRTVTEEELKKSYRRLAIQHHPDRNPGNKTAEEKFKEINEAYQILSDPQKRSAYDQFGHGGVGGGGFGGFDQGFTGSFSDIFDNIFGDIFGGGAGGASGGVDLRYNLELTFEEAAFGVERKVSFEKETACETCHGSGAKPGTKPKPCRGCRGTGQVRFNQGFFTLSRTCSNCLGRGAIVEEKCPECRGRGRVKRPHSVLVKVPAGIDNNQRLRLRGEGELSEPGGQSGDLYVQIHVKEHPLFRREEEHVILDLPISFVQAAVGADVDTPTLHGLMKLKISPGTQSGEVARLKGKGIKRLNGSGYGDQLVRILVETPTRLTSRQRELLLEFESTGEGDVTHPGIASFLQKLKENLQDMRVISSLFFAVILAMVTGCVSTRPSQPTGIGAAATPKTRQIEPEARPLFFEAERDYNAKAYDQAVRLYRNVKVRFPHGRAHLLASYRLGTIYYYRADYEEAAREFEYFLGHFAQSDLAFDVTYNLAATQYQLGQYDRASQTLSRLRTPEIQTQGTRRAEVVYQLSAQIGGALGDHPAVVKAYASILQLPVDEPTRERLAQNIDVHLNRVNAHSDLVRMMEEVTEPSTRAKIQARLATLEPEVIPPAVTVPPGTEAGTPLGPGGELAERLNVGVVLPLTGRFAPYGRRALDGILLAAQSYNASHDLELRIFVEDSGGTSVQAAQAVDTLFHENHVMAIIGPLNWKEALAVADRAQQLGVLNLSLSSKEGISEHGPYLFQNALTPRVQLDNLVRFCVVEKQFKRFAIMAPNNSFGKDLANEFWDLVEKYGGHVVGYETYSPDEKDFQKPVEELVGLSNLNFRRFEITKMNEYITAQKAKTGREPKVRLPPVVDFDALFIPDSPKAGAQIGASLAYFDAGGIPLLGTTEWNSDLLYKRGGRYVEGAIFPGGISTASKNIRQQQFIRLFTNAYGSPPDLLASQAYEAMSLVATAIKKVASGDRNELVNTLVSLKDFETPLGNLTFDPTRIAQRKIPIYTLESGGNIVEE